jgi:hypothetical protein
MRLTLYLILPLIFSLLVRECGASGYGEISRKLIAGAKASGAARIGVLAFTPRGGAAKSEAE